jgi:hypothetical protein
MSRNVEQRVIAPVPVGYRFRISGYRKEASDRGLLPVDGSKDHRDDDGVASSVATEGRSHLSAIAVIRVYEVGTDEEKHNVGARESLIDGGVNILASTYFPIIPSFNEGASAQR